MSLKSDLRDLLDLAEKTRAERKERRLMKTSTYDALLESVDEESIPAGAEQEIHEDLLKDTIAVEKRRWMERASWITLAVITAGTGWVGGWYFQQQDEPVPWDCTVKVAPEATLVDPTIMRCVGGEMPE